MTPLGRPSGPWSIFANAAYFSIGIKAVRQRGRKSAASHNVVSLNVNRPKVLAVPKGLTIVERDIFERTARFIR